MDPSKTTDLGIKCSLIFHDFSKPLLEIVFRGSQCRSCLHWSILLPFSILGISKKAFFGPPFSLEISIWSYAAVVWKRSLARPCFSSTIVITVPLGPTGFQNIIFYCAAGADWFSKRHFWDRDLLMFCFFYFS